MPPADALLTTPVPTLKVDGAVAERTDLISLSVSQSLGAAAHAQLRLYEVDKWIAKYKVGKSLVIAADPGTGVPTDVFTGAIVSVGLDWRADRSVLVVDAYDASHKLAQQTVIKNYLENSAAQVIQAIARECGLSTDIASDLRSPVYPYIQQFGTNHQMISELVHNAGCEWWVEGTKIVVKPRDAAGAASVTLNGHRDLRRFSARFSAMDRVKKVNVRGWNSKTKSVVTANATGVNNGAPATPPISSEGDAPSGEATSWPGRVASTDDADVLAQGIAARMGSTVLSAKGECWVKTDLRPGVVAKIEEVSTKWNGNYYITEAEHVFTRENGFITRFAAGGSDDESIGGMIGRSGRSGSGRLTDGLTIGLVTNNQDPDGMQRVKVTFPYMSDNDESTWARLVLPGAGKARGLMIVPEVDDEVLVGFENGDIRRPFVLGGLWNGKDKPANADLVVSGKVKTRSLTSRKGHQVMIEDTDSAASDTITLTLKDGKATLILGGDKMSIIHKDDVPVSIETPKATFKIAAGGDVKVTGTNITIEAQQAITLKAGTDVKIEAGTGLTAKANTKVSIKGTGGVDVDGSPALTNVKGSMVMIN
jgi:uncharacterized protein involved in type VI secretion and phage assembly